MKILMIHEVRKWMLDLDLSEYDIITFDDGLYSQYYYYKHFLKFNKPMYFFISTKITCPEKTFQNEVFPRCDIAHQEFFENGVKRNYMKWSQIKEIYNTKNCFIGGHSHNHYRLKDKSLRESVKICQADINEMLREFRYNDIEINSFCFPYNEDIMGYRAALKDHKITYFGNERIAIEELK